MSSRKQQGAKQARPQTHPRDDKPEVLVSSAARIAICAQCQQIREGWSACYANNRNAAGSFYCKWCWADYDGQVQDGVLEYAGMSWHDEILKAEQESTDEDDIGQSLAWLRSRLKEMETEPIPPLEDRAKLQSVTGDVCQSEESDDEADEGAEEDVLMPLPGTTSAKLPLKGRQPAARAHVIVLIDTSGSMRTSDVESPDTWGSFVTRMQAVHDTLKTFFDQRELCESSDLYSLVSFNSSAIVHFEALPARQASGKVDPQKLPPARNGTEFEVGLDRVARLVHQHADTGTPHLVVLSDGRPASPARMLDKAQELLASVPALRIHAIGFGDSLDSFDFLQQMTSISSGMFVPSSLSVSAMRQAFLSVSSTISMTQTSFTAFSFGARREGPPPPGEGHNKERAQPRCRQVRFEPANQFFFGTNCSLQMECSRSWLVYDGNKFHCRKAQGGNYYPVSLRFQPFTKGGMRVVYCFLDSTIPRRCEQGRDSYAMSEAGTDARMVAKLSKYDDPWHNSEEVVSAYSRSSAVAKFHARIFMMAAASKLAALGRTMARIIFVECYLYKVKDGSDAPAPFMIGERYLPGTFVKYNSNKGYVNKDAPDTEVAQAFSHFTYMMTRGKMMVLDLQGVYLDKLHRRRPHLILTDSQVVSMDRSFGPGDLGVKGISAFFQSHKCGPTCRGLGLNSGPNAQPPPPPSSPPPPAPVLQARPQASAAGAGASLQSHPVRQWQNAQVVQEVRKHHKMGCALVSISDMELHQSILRLYRTATIAGVRAEIRQDKNQAKSLFVAWGSAAERERHLSSCTIKEFFEQIGAKVRSHEDRREGSVETQSRAPNPKQQSKRPAESSSSSSSSSALLPYAAEVLERTLQRAPPEPLACPQPQPTLEVAVPVPAQSSAQPLKELKQLSDLPVFGEPPADAPGPGPRAVVHCPGQRKVVLPCADRAVVARAIAAEYGIPEEEQLLLQEPQAADGACFYRLDRKMDARQLLFTQAHISPNFRDGRPIYELLNDINCGGLDPLRELDPLDVVSFDGKWWSCSNRRLWALKHCCAATSGQPVWVRVQVRPADSRFREKHSTANGGIAVRITRSRSPSPASRGGISDTTLSSLS